MTQQTQFDHGYALLIGVNDNQAPRFKLSGVAKDVAKLSAVLTHPERCAYPEENIRVVQGADATKEGILAGFAWLQQQISRDSNATAVVYYSGHGYQDMSTLPANYYLIPYDVNEERLRQSMLPAETIIQRVGALQPQRLLAILDCCHAHGIEAKGGGAMGEQPSALTSLIASAFPAAALTGNTGINIVETQAKGGNIVSALATGSGRAILSSSQGGQKSYMRTDGTMSVFTYHLIAALTGHARQSDSDREVLVSDVLSYVYRKVPASVSDLGVTQQPDARLDGIFPIALLLGGKGIAKDGSAPDPLAPLDADASAIPASITNTGSGGLAVGEGATAAGKRSVIIGGNAESSTIVTGNENRVGGVDTGGGTYIGGGVDVGRDFVERDKIVLGDDLQGKKTEGDDISVGNISGQSNVAAGRGASANTFNRTEDEKASAESINRFCSECGSSLTQGAKFCANCGTKVEPE